VRLIVPLAEFRSATTPVAPPPTILAVTFIVPLVVLFTVLILVDAADPLIVRDDPLIVSVPVVVTDTHVDEPDII
jgi:hypothetical protein